MNRRFLCKAVALSVLAVSGVARPATFTVTTAAASGPGSLLAAVQAANAQAGPDTIVFSIPGPGPHRIAPAGALLVTESVFVDGYTQPGARPNTLAGASTNAVLRIIVDGAAVPPVTHPSDEPQYVVILLVDHFGSTLTGLALVNTPNQMIGIDGGGEHRIVGNFIGIEPDGSPAGNGGGVNIWMSEFNRVGGTNPAERNLIASRVHDFHIGGAGSWRNAILGNLIGTDRVGRPLAGRDPFLSSIVITNGASHNWIGSNSAGGGNHLAAGGWGVRINTGGIANEVVGSTFRSISYPIDLGTLQGRNPNDPLDADEGPNELLNHPVLMDTRSPGPGQLELTGTIDTNPNSEIRISFYGTLRCADTAQSIQDIDHSLGYTTVVTDAAGHASFNALVEVGEIPPSGVLATAGRESAFVYSTSEFSPCLTVPMPSWHVAIFRDGFDQS